MARYNSLRKANDEVDLLRAKVKILQKRNEEQRQDIMTLVESIRQASFDNTSRNFRDRS